MIYIKQPFNSLIERILLKIFIHYIFYNLTIGLDIIEPYATAVLGMLEPLTSVNQVHIDTGVNH